MAQGRLTMRKTREILRLKASGLSNRAIGRALQVSNSTVGAYLKRAKQAGMSWPLEKDLSEEQVFQRLFPENPAPPENTRPEPDWEVVKQELKRKGVTLKLLWLEYQEQHPEGYKYTQYCVKYREWAKRQQVRGRFLHRGGEVMEVDYAGVKMTITDPQSGETSQAAVFVASMVASSYIYAEVQANEQKENWLSGHVKAFEFFGIFYKPIYVKMLS